MAASGASLLKIATRANRLSDNLVIAEVLRHAARRRQDVCALAMGRVGIPSRVLGPLWGSWMTFASLPGGEPTADGQLPADQLVDLYRVRRIGPDTQIYGVLGRPLAHSLSPRLHNSVFAAQNRDAVYLPLEASDIEDFLRFYEAVPLQGASVTIPFKEEVHARSASLSVDADRTGAVNTVLRRDGFWHGENTDIEGFLRPLRRRAHVGKLRAVVLGAGGAARAVVYALTSNGASVCVVARNPAKGQHLAREFAAEHAPWGQLKGLSWNLLVNATPVGMHPDVEASPVPAEWLTGEWVYDLVYNPRETRLLQDAARRGCRVIGGCEMFLAQAVKQQALWFGAQPPEDVMQAALDEGLLPTGPAPSRIR
jgi:3-dehydroquinate dehydratase/shikimate dehydrogenase